MELRSVEPPEMLLASAVGAPCDGGTSEQWRPLRSFVVEFENWRAIQNKTANSYVIEIAI